MVTQLAPQIETILASVPAGPLVCRKLLLCNGHPQQVKLLGDHVCTRGPSYWCQNTTTAAECNVSQGLILKIYSLSNL